MNNRSNTKLNKVIRVFSLLTYLGTLLVLLFCMNEKSGYHMDEICTYIQSNFKEFGSSVIVPECGVKYENPGDLWVHFTSVPENGRFDYRGVYIGTKDDNHPPLYFVLVHTLSSFFPGVFSKWFAGAVNILFGLLTLWISRKIVRFYTNDEKCVLVFSGLTMISSAFITSVTYLRMYEMSMFFNTLLIYLLLRGIRKRDARFYILTAATVYLSVLSHYYNAIFVFFASAVFCILLLAKKNFKDVLWYVCAMASAALLFLASFPAAIRQVFGGENRGGEAFDAFSEGPAVYLYKLKACYRVISDHLFGGYLSVVLAVLLVLFAIYLVSQKRRSITKRTAGGDSVSVGKSVTATDFVTAGRMAVTTADWVLPACAVLGFFLVVTFVTPYETCRYFFPIYALLLILVLCGIYCLILHFGKGSWLPSIVVLVLFGALTLIGFKPGMYYLYRSVRTDAEAVMQHPTTDCIFCFHKKHELNPNMPVAENMASITFYDLSEGTPDFETAQIDPSEGLYLWLGSPFTDADLDAQVHEIWPSLKERTQVSSYLDGIIWYYAP